MAITTRPRSLPSLILLLTTLLASFPTSIFARPAPQTLVDLFLAEAASIANSNNNEFLRIMPLGASITAGQHSSDNNGYRQALRTSLRNEGWPLRMVGNRIAGTMRDNAVSAVPGYTIDQVHGLANRSLIYQPNLVLINAGTNDCIQDIDMPAAPARMSALLDTLYDNIEGVTILLSTLLPSNRDDLSARAPAYNDALRQMVASRAENGDRIVLAEMDGGRIDPDTLPDDIHPSDEGYRIMADIWFEAFGRAKELLQPATPTDFSDEILDD
jgi:lysophospholipase L1-like esterase